MKSLAKQVFLILMVTGTALGLGLFVRHLVKQAEAGREADRVQAAQAVRARLCDELETAILAVQTCYRSQPECKLTAKDLADYIDNSIAIREFCGVSMGTLTEPTQPTVPDEEDEFEKPGPPGHVIPRLPPKATT
jgi:hypothetical protein